MKLVVKKADEEDAPKPANGSKISCHYTGFLRDGGKQFDSSKSRGDLFKFNLGRGNVIKGWDQGIATMQIGERAILRCSSDFAYGDNGSLPSIPPGATLDFVVELEDANDFESIWDIDDAKESIMKKVVKEPKGWETVKEASTVTMNIIGREKDAKGRIFVDLKDEVLEVPYDLEFEHKGISPEYPHPRGLYKCIQQLGAESTMHFLIKCTEFYAYGKTGCEKYGVAPNTDLYYELTLTKMDCPKSLFQLSNEEKVPFAKELKTKAGTYFKKKKLNVAVKLYKDVVDAVKNIQGLDDEQKKDVDNLKVTCHSNLALVMSQLGDNTDALKEIEEGLKIDPTHIKLRYRKAQVEFKRANYEDSLSLLQNILTDAPDNKAAIVLKAKVLAKRKAVQKQQRSLAKKMFGGFGKKKKSSKSAAAAEKKTEEPAGGVKEADAKEAEAAPPATTAE